jgi:predicted transcriptional regulator
MKADPHSLPITLTDEQMGIIAYIAEKEHKSLSLVASDLIALALELEEEDRYLSAIAEERERTNTGWISHEEVWK